MREQSPTSPDNPDHTTPRPRDVRTRVVSGQVPAKPFQLSDTAPYIMVTLMLVGLGTVIYGVWAALTWLF